MTPRISLIHTLSLFLSIAIATPICKPGEIALGTIFVYQNARSNIPLYSEGAIFDSDCQPINISDKPTWKDGGWRNGISVSQADEPRTWLGPTLVTIDGKIYTNCYSSASNRCTLNKRKRDDKYYSASLPYCCSPYPDFQSKEQKQGFVAQKPEEDFEDLDSLDGLDGLDSLDGLEDWE